LIEARRTEERSYKSLVHELKLCGKEKIDTLHITSWDNDHCNLGDLKWILENLAPSKIEYPGYEPHSDTARECLSVIRHLERKSRAVKLLKVDPPFILQLENGKHLGYSDIFYHPKKLRDGESNNNSTVKLFRTGMFNVASLGDIEHADIAGLLRRCKIFRNEVDVLILAHHGAANDVNKKSLIEAVNPKVAIAASNFSNQYEHPDPSVCEMLRKQDVFVCTTKRGDVVVESLKNHNVHYQVTNLIADSTEVSERREFRSRKADLLTKNSDSIRNFYHPGFKKLK
jgi:competence protein ComEC